jgi:hypothetical protein
MCSRRTRLTSEFLLNIGMATREEINTLPRGRNRSQRFPGLGQVNVICHEPNPETPYSQYMSTGFWHLPEEKLQALGEPVD